MRILDRMEHRQSGLGLRFWGQPLWLEVTMTGPDSDSWPATSDEVSSWNWHSSEPCHEATRLDEQDADDDTLLEAVARYTVENLVLNAVHEIGEWFRFDGCRLFPAHLLGIPSSARRDRQGNGQVILSTVFDGADDEGSAGPPLEALIADGRLQRLTEVAVAARFTYLPYTSIEYLAGGPVIRRHSFGRLPQVWPATWSAATIDALDSGAGAPEQLRAMQRDVHRALVLCETDRICQAFHLDGRRHWHLAGRPSTASGPPEPDTGVLALTIDYDPVSAGGER